MLTYLKVKTSLLTTFLICFCSCKKTISPSTFDYGTENDTALFYYQRGWQQIMDNGEWTLAEVSFRKASESDPDFILAKCLKGRISQDLEEREKLLGEIIAAEEKASQDQKLLIEVYKSSLQLMNKREAGIKLDKSTISDHYKLSEKNTRKFVHKYPNEDYVKAEYIEILHANHGAELALDSMNTIAARNQLELPFYLGYAAAMQAELSNFEEALQLLDKQRKVLNDSLKPQFYASSAEVYFEMDSIKLARKYIDKAVKLDSNHLIAKGLQKKISLIDYKL